MSNGSISPVTLSVCLSVCVSLLPLPSLSLNVSPFLYLHVPLSLSLAPLSPPRSSLLYVQTVAANEVVPCVWLLCVFRFISEKESFAATRSRHRTPWLVLVIHFPQHGQMRSAPSVTSPELCGATSQVLIQRHARGFNVFLRHMFVVLSGDQY